MGRQESPQLIERKTQVDTDAQETSRASKYSNHNSFTSKLPSWKKYMRVQRRHKHILYSIFRDGFIEILIDLQVDEDIL